jgi:uncharacterized membrane protein
METYEILKAVHVLGAAIWVGGAIVMQVLDLRAARAPDADVAADLRAAEFVGTRVFIPASLIVLAAGIGLLIDGAWELQLWVVAGLTVWALSFFTGAMFLGPQAGKILRLIDSQGPRSSEVALRLRRLRLVSHTEDWLLVAILIIMVTKPG